jgi:monoamine oxidase
MNRKKNQQKIVIIGAGISGLVAARKLSEHYQVTVLEATSQSGGRIKTLHQNGILLEAGPEFVHGRLKKTWDLLKEAQIKCTEVGGYMYRKENGLLEKQEEMIEGWDDLLDKMKLVRDDMVLTKFLALYFPGDRYADLRKQAINYTEGFDLADAERVSVKYLYQEWSNMDEAHYRPEGGYSGVVDFLENKCRENACQFFYEKKVSVVNWKEGNVRIRTDKEEIFEADKCIITLPVSLLGDGNDGSSLRFEPGLEYYQKAAGEIGMGKVIKVILHFKERLWPADTGFLFSDEIFPTWWTQLPNETPLLTGWAGGERARKLKSSSEDFILDKAVHSVASILDLPVENIRSSLNASFIFNWQENEYARGAYSYGLPGSPAAREMLAKPVADTIYFTGEGLYEGDSPGTVEAAIVQAEKTVGKILAN